MKLLRSIAAVAAGLAFATLATAQGYPNKPVRIIVAYQAGQGTDVATRYIAERLNKALGQNFYIENKPAPAATSAPRPPRVPRPTATR